MSERTTGATPEQIASAVAQCDDSLVIATALIRRAVADAVRDAVKPDQRIVDVYDLKVVLLHLDQNTPIAKRIRALIGGDA